MSKTAKDKDRGAGRNLLSRAWAAARKALDGEGGPRWRISDTGTLFLDHEGAAVALGITAREVRAACFRGEMHDSDVNSARWKGPSKWISSLSAKHYAAKKGLEFRPWLVTGERSGQC